MNDLVVTLSARVDSWKNYNGHIFETSVATGLPTAGNRGDLPDKDDTVVSPRAAALYQLSDRVSVWGDIGWGFRAPTLNELYRQFSVGLTRTLANETLGPERLFGGEAGVRLEAARNVSIRSTLLRQQREESGLQRDHRRQSAAASEPGTHAHSRLAERRRDARWTVRCASAAGYLFNNAKVTEYDPVPVPGVRWSISRACTCRRCRSIAARSAWRTRIRASSTLPSPACFYGRQFDDDLNARIKPGETEPGLPAYGVVDFSASRDIGRNLEVFFGVQNLFDQEYYVQLLPTTIGSPRLVNGGVRVRWSGR